MSDSSAAPAAAPESLHWNHVLSLIKEEKTQSIAVRDLAENLNVPYDHDGLLRTLNILIRLRKVRILLGRTKSGAIGRIVMLEKEHETRRTFLKETEYGDKPLKEFEFDSKPAKGPTNFVDD